MTSEAVPTVVCVRCTGTTLTLDRCRCRDGDGNFLVDQPVGAPNDDGRPWPDCELCTGDGTVARPCPECSGHGRRRAQLVLTVANLDTGAVASANVVPGSVDPTPGPDGWRIALGPLLAELASRAGAAPATLREVFTPDRPPEPDGQLSVLLNRRWRPDLAGVDRYDFEARALANRSYAPWLVFLGRTTAPDPPDPSDLAGHLDRLRRLADRLCLDLVVEARSTGYGTPNWDIRLETFGTQVPRRPHGYHPDLPTAVERTSVADACYGLAERCLTAPAHYLDPRLPDPHPLPVEPVDVDQLERRILRDCADAPGAQAIWRDGRWRHTSLHTADTTATLTELETGQVARRHATILARTWEPPAPSWLGDPIPSTPCRDCHGTGTREWLLPCHTCSGSRRTCHGAVLTVTDLAGRVVHLNWRPDDSAAPATLVGTQPAGQPVVQLADRYRLRPWSSIFGVRPDELVELDSDRAVDHDLLDGIVTVLRPGDDPALSYLATVSRGRPGGRLLVSAAGWDAPPLTRLARVVHGIGLVLRVIVADHRHNAGDPRLVQGLRWQVDVVGTQSPPDDDTAIPSHRSLPEAVAYCLRYLGSDLHRSLPTAPDRPIGVPQQPVPPDDLPDPTEQVRELAARHPGQPVTARLVRTGWQVRIPE
ncbi:hypothetical protein I0C86_40125 [Plantactinospora sp. S1510]|uniref:Uncharacterized protein n=1 Tax=Plantactinospora alkalitolerans TaxID=2789879 RepID=A0ABS0HAG7_9ACTN|nr:hypothetical protein [Plantactinospora alkalitolerans]MBF9135087.1 hypothetical protein [Plantactinospora alkalitolerans]